MSWLAVAVATALSLAAAPARADTQIGVDLDFALPADDLGDTGGGFAVRLGPQLRSPLFALTPEIAFAYHGFPGRGEPSSYRGVAGARLGFGEVFRIGPFAHLGIGRLEAELAGRDYGRTAFTFDVGAFFTFTLLPLINVGVHGAYNQISGDDTPSFEWWTLGAHGELIL